MKATSRECHAHIHAGLLVYTSPCPCPTLCLLVMIEGERLHMPMSLYNARSSFT